MASPHKLSLNTQAIRGTIFEGHVVSSGKLSLRLFLFWRDHAISVINLTSVRPKGFLSDGRVASTHVLRALGGAWGTPVQHRSILVPTKLILLLFWRTPAQHSSILVEYTIASGTISEVCVASSGKLSVNT